MNPFTGLAAVVVGAAEVVPSVVEAGVVPDHRLEGAAAVEPELPVHRSVEAVELVLVPDRVVVVVEISGEAWVVWAAVAPRCHLHVQISEVLLALEAVAAIARQMAWEALVQGRVVA